MSKAGCHNDWEMDLTVVENTVCKGAKMYIGNFEDWMEKYDYTY